MKITYQLSPQPCALSNLEGEDLARGAIDDVIQGKI